MSQLRESAYPTPSRPGANFTATALSAIVYRSQAVTPLASYQLYELVQAAQIRNQADGITGLMLYDEGRFYQWIEGPAANVSRLMNSISNDKRHHDIEILSDRPVAARQFADWTMRLATRGARSIHSVHNVIVPPDRIFDELAPRGGNPAPHPGNVRSVLASLATALHAEPDLALPPAIIDNKPLQGEAAQLLQEVIISSVIPRLIARHTSQGTTPLWPIDSRACALADLLIRPDHEAVVEFLRALQDPDGSIKPLYETLIEPAARRLGDLWDADQCSEFDITLGLGQLQRAIRRLGEDALPVIPVGMIMPSVLVVPEPGEIHALNAVLDSESLWQAGWDPQSEYPATDEALQELMTANWFDALDLSLSPSFRREHWLPRVTKTIALARHASRNPALVVVVAGRIFAENGTAGAEVGADAASRTTRQTGQTIRESLGRLKPRR